MPCAAYNRLQAPRASADCYKGRNVTKSSVRYVLLYLHCHYRECTRTYSSWLVCWESAIISHTSSNVIFFPSYITFPWQSDPMKLIEVQLHYTSAFSNAKLDKRLKMSLVGRLTLWGQIGQWAGRDAGLQHEILKLYFCQMRIFGRWSTSIFCDFHVHISYRK